LDTKNFISLRCDGHTHSHPSNCPLYSRSSLIFILTVITGQAKTLHTKVILQAVRRQLILSAIHTGFEADVFITG